MEGLIFSGFVFDRFAFGRFTFYILFCSWPLRFCVRHFRFWPFLILMGFFFSLLAVSYFLFRWFRFCAVLFLRPFFFATALPGRLYTNSFSNRWLLRKTRCAEEPPCQCLGTLPVSLQSGVRHRCCWRVGSIMVCCLISVFCLVLSG